MAVFATSDLSNGYLRGQVLIATPALNDGCFDKTVIYLCEHNAEGAMGVIINRPIANIRLGEILRALNIVTENDIGDLPVYFGGPVEPQRGFVLHTSDVALDDTVVGTDGISLTAHIAILRGIAEGQGPKEGFLALGYAGWGPGQLEAELENGSWISAPATSKLVFGSDNELKWSLAAAALGVDLGRLSSQVGHA